VFLVGWGGYVLATGDFVATLDIGAGLVGTGIAVIALTAVVRVLERIAQSLADRPQAAAISARPEGEPRRASPPPPSSAYAPPPPAQAQSAPSVVREGDIEGHHYRFFSDGSIEAEGPRGMRRYRSIDEAREQILREREEVQSASESRSPPRKPDAAPAPARPRPPAAENYTPRYVAPRAGGAPAGEGDDPYVPRYAPPKAPPAPEDEEWSEPFRMLLKGDNGSSKPGGKR
jgi:hypothetical protein